MREERRAQQPNHPLELARKATCVSGLHERCQMPLAINSATLAPGAWRSI